MFSRETSEVTWEQVEIDMTTQDVRGGTEHAVESGSRVQGTRNIGWILENCSCQGRHRVTNGPLHTGCNNRDDKLQQEPRRRQKTTERKPGMLC